MDGREVQGQHSRGFFDGVNSQLGHHPQGLHSTGLPHENLFGMHPSLQQIYPFGVRRSSIPSVSGSASDLSNTIGLGNDSSSRIPSTLGSPTLNTPSMGGPGWWLPPGFSAGLPTSDIHSSFSQMPWNNHDQDPLLSGHESLGSMHPHTSHLRGNLPNGMLPVSSIGNSPYLPHSRGSSSLHSGTLIHFPHSTGQSVVKSDPPWALGGSETLSHSAKANTALEFSHKESSRRKDLTNDPLLSGGLDTANKVRHPEISASSSNSAVLKTNNDILDDPFNLDLNPFDENIPSVRGIDKPGPALPKSQEPPRSFSQDAPKKSEQVQVQENPSYKLPEPRTARFHPQASQHEQFSRKAGPNSQQSQRQQFSRKESESSHPSQYEQFSRKESQPSKSFSDLPSVSMPTKLSENTPKERFSSQKKSAPVQSTHLSTPVANSKQTSHPPHSSGALENTPFPSKQGSSVEIWHNLELNSSRDFDSSAEDSDFFPGQSPPKNAKAGLSLENQNLTLEFQEKPKKELPFYDSPLNSTLPPQTSTNSGNKNDLDQKTAAKSSRRPFSVDFLSVSSGSEKKGEKLTPGTDTKQREVSKGIVTNSTSSDRISVIKAAPQVTQAKEVVRNTNIYANTQALNSRSSASKPAVATAAEVKTPPPSSEVKMTVMPRPPTLPIPPPAVPKPLIATFKGMPYNSQDAKDEEESKSSSSESGSEEESESEEEEESEVEEEEEEEEEEDDDEEKQENDESKDESEEDSGEESDAESSEEEESEDEDELEMDDDSKQGESASQDLSPGKRKANDHGAHPAKRRKVVDEELIKLPLAKGWRRQTRLRPTGSGDVLRGDVYYFSPCGKKLRTYPEVSKYLEKNNVRDLKLDNFTFSTKVTVGEFLEAKQGSKFEVLSEEEVQRRHQLEKDRQRKREEQLQKKKDKKRLQAEMARKAQEARQRKKLERQAASEAAKAQKKAKEEEKVRSKIERQQALEAAKQAKKERERLIAEQRRIAKERAKQEREMDRLRKLEEKRLEKEMKLRSIQEEKMRKKELLRMEREMRARQIQEAKERKKEAIHQAKMEEAVRKAREREMKRQQAEAMKSQEKERRKQHMMMVRALESQRKAEERERKKEEKRLEKRLLKQRKMEQKRLERQIARELKKPVDDMALNDGKALPDFPRVKGVSIPGEAYANLMMVEEFVWCFGHVLDIDPETDFPSLADLQNSLLSECLKKNPLITACKSLLKTALSDPGSAGLSATNELGVALENIELTEFNVSEVLRLFILSRNERNSQEIFRFGR